MATDLVEMKRTNDLFESLARKVCFYPSRSFVDLEDDLEVEEPIAIVNPWPSHARIGPCFVFRAHRGYWFVAAAPREGRFAVGFASWEKYQAAWVDTSPPEVAWRKERELERLGGRIRLGLVSSMRSVRTLGTEGSTERRSPRCSAFARRM